jgi:hypothetical protein
MAGCAGFVLRKEQAQTECSLRTSIFPHECHQDVRYNLYTLWVETSPSECFKRRAIISRKARCENEYFDCKYEETDCESFGGSTDCGNSMVAIGNAYSTAFHMCDDDCSTGSRLECPLPSEVQLLGRARITKADWQSYVLQLYGADESQLALLPRIDQVDMVYTDMLQIHGVRPIEDQDFCPYAAAHTPKKLSQLHPTRAAYYYHLPPTPAKSYAWVEVTHCFSNFEFDGAWFFPMRGSGIFVNVGRTLVFDEQFQAQEFFGVIDADGENGGFNNVAQAAAAAGYDSVQFMAHCEGCQCYSELVITNRQANLPRQARGGPLTTCMEGLIEFRTGANASRPCTCQEIKIGAFSTDSAARPECITCSSFAGFLEENQLPGGGGDDDDNDR